jgi:hypothetical protein
MKKIKLIIIFLLFTNMLCAFDSRTKYHVGVSAAIGYASETILHEVAILSDAEKILLATLPAIGIGAYKELQDEQGEKGDMLANALGSVIGAVLANTLNNNFFFKVDHKERIKQTKMSIGYNF